jgi:hypothetical protein
VTQRAPYVTVSSHGSGTGTAVDDGRGCWQEALAVFQALDVPAAEHARELLERVRALTEDGQADKHAKYWEQAFTALAALSATRQRRRTDISLRSVLLA